MNKTFHGVAICDANGEVVVRLPEAGGTLARDVHYQLTCIGSFAPVYVADEVKSHCFKIAGGRSGSKISWEVSFAYTDDEAIGRPAHASAPASLPELSPRARETLAVMMSGASDKEIAKAMGISPHTVRQYVKTLHRAYGVSSRARLIALMHGAAPKIEAPRPTTMPSTARAAVHKVTHKVTHKMLPKVVIEKSHPARGPRETLIEGARASNRRAHVDRRAV